MFKTVQEAFNHYRTYEVSAIEKRAQEIRGMIEIDPDVDIKALNIELTALNEAKINQEEKLESQPEERNFKLVGMQKNESKPEYRSVFFKALIGKELSAQEKRFLQDRIQVEKRENSYTTSGNTPVVIPKETLNEIVSKARAEGGVISIARQFNVPAGISVPVATPSAAAAWHTEGAAVESEKPDLAGVNFNAHEILKVFSISQKVRTMAVPAFEAYLQDELRKCVFETIANSLINGTGVNQGYGLETVTWDNSNSVSTTEPTYADIVKLVGLLKRGYHKNATIVMNNQTLFNIIYGMTDLNGNPVFVNDPQNDVIGRVLGYPVIVDDYVQDNVIYFGDFKYLGYNLPEGIAVEASTQSSFKSGLIDFRGMAVADTQVITSDAFTKLAVTA